MSGDVAQRSGPSIGIPVAERQGYEVAYENANTWLGFAMAR